MNDGPENKDTGKQTTQENTEKAAQAPRPTTTTNVDDLKAKLGLTSRPKKKSKPKPGPEKPAQKPEKQQPQPQHQAQAAQPSPEPQLYDDIPPDEEALDAIRSSRKRWIIVVSIVGLIALLIGVLFGKIMRDRKIDNRRTEEARFVLHYLEHARGAKLTETTILDAVQDFNSKVQDLAKAFAKANTPAKKQAVEKSLRDFLKDAAKFSGKAAYFSMDSAFPSVIYNQKMAFKVVQFINDVKEFNRLAGLLAREGMILNTLVGPDPTKKEFRYFEIEPIKEKGISLNKGTWVEAINWKGLKATRQGQLIPIKPFGAKEGYYVSTKNLAKVDIAPMARAKAAIYKRMIFAKVATLFQQLKLQGDKLDFPTLKKELQHYANREMLFTIF